MRHAVAFVFLVFHLSGIGQTVVWQKKLFSDRSELIRAVRRDSSGGFTVLSAMAVHNSGEFYLSHYTVDFELDWRHSFHATSPLFEPSDFLKLPQNEYLVVGTARLGPENTDIGVYKIGAEGQVVSFTTFGGTRVDYPTGITNLPDGHFMVYGSSNSDVSGSKTEPCRGQFDYWLIKIDTALRILNQKTFGGNHDDRIQEVYPTQEGNLLVWGYSLSGDNKDKTVKGLGDWDGWIVTFDSNWKDLSQIALGNASENRIGGTALRIGKEYIFSSADRDNSPARQYDISFHEVGSAGDVTVRKSLLTNKHDAPGNMYRTCDGGYILAAVSRADIGGDKSDSCRGGNDIWIVRMDKHMNLLWDKTIGGSTDESFPLLHRISRRDYLLTFQSNSPSSGDLSQDNPEHKYGLYVFRIIDEAIPVSFLGQLFKGCGPCKSLRKLTARDLKPYLPSEGYLNLDLPED